MSIPIVGQTPEVAFLYFGDPMCSWCYGFSGSIESLLTRFRIPLTIIVGGLRGGDAQGPVDDEAAEMLAHHWTQVAEHAGVDFDHDILERRDWHYDTEPSCRAVVTMREQAPDQVVAFMRRLQEAFYKEGVDLTDAESYRQLAEGFAPDVDAFMAAWESDEMKARAQADFQIARQLGIHRFPTLLIKDGEANLVLVTQGWVPGEVLLPAVDAWLKERFGTVPAELLHAPDDAPVIETP